MVLMPHAAPLSGCISAMAARMAASSVDTGLAATRRRIPSLLRGDGECGDTGDDVDVDVDVDMAAAVRSSGGGTPDEDRCVRLGVRGDTGEDEAERFFVRVAGVANDMMAHYSTYTHRHDAT